MSVAFARTDRSLLGRWWWTVDKVTLVCLLTLMGLGVMLIAAASPPVAEAHGLPTFHFVAKHLLLLGPSLAMMILISVADTRLVRRMALLGFLVSLVLLALTLGYGFEAKGARRWLELPFLTLQPSELAKPCFAVASAWLLSRGRELRDPLFFGLAGLGWVMTAGLLILQPDFGQTVVVTSIFAVQVFLVGLPMVLVGGGALALVLGGFAAYGLLPHVQSRIDRFLDPSAGDSYQVMRSLEAFQKGGLTGVGPGQGTVKLALPDAHADFIFAVAGEEMGLAFTLLLVGLFAVIVIRGVQRLQAGGDLFTLLAASGLIVQLGLQALIHMGSSLKLLPAKGMTLPFISYGGSSLLTLGLAAGMLLALTRKGATPGGES